MKNQRKNVTRKKSVKLPIITFAWNKHRPTSSAEVLINGKLVVFIFCSIISAFINLVFISNLTKSDYTIGTLLSIPAAVLLGFLSIGLDTAKFLLAIQVNTLSELVRKLSQFKWSKKVKAAAAWWRSIYIVFILLSIITSVSLSTISIGAGISRNANMIASLDSEINKGEVYTNINSATKDVTTRSLIEKATDTSEKDAIIFVDTQTKEVWPLVEEWQKEYSEFTKVLKLDPDDRTELEEPYKGYSNYYDYWDARDAQINVALQSSRYSKTKLTERQINALTLSAFEQGVKNNYLLARQTENNDIALEKLLTLSDNTDDEIRAWLETLNALNLVNPKTGELVQFSTDTNKAAIVLAKSAVTLLKALRVDVENDSGDIGSSSKIFMQIGSFWDSKHVGDKDLQAALNVQTKGSFGTTEVLMMGMLLFLSLLCELAINLFSPKTNISRKMLSQFSEYFSPDFNVNDFMLDIYLDQLDFGVLDRDVFDRKARKAVELSVINKEYLYNHFLPTNEENTIKEETPQEKNYSEAVDKKMKEIDKMIEDRFNGRERNS